MEKQLRAPGGLCLLRFEAGMEATGQVLAKDKPTWPHIPASLYGDSVFLLCLSPGCLSRDNKTAQIMFCEVFFFPVSELWRLFFFLLVVGFSAQTC